MKRLFALVIAGAVGAAPAPAGTTPEPPPPAPSAQQLAESVRLLEPQVRLLEPRVRPLRTEARDGQQTTVTISSDVLFDFDSAELTPRARQIVADLAPRIAAAGTAVLVVGHTDGIGEPAYNQDLSERRAAAVVAALQADLGPAPAITAEGRGSTEPVAPEVVDGQDDPAGRALNRRVAVAFSEPA